LASQNGFPKFSLENSRIFYVLLDFWKRHPTPDTFGVVSILTRTREYSSFEIILITAVELWTLKLTKN
jgi:hypothetical protein